MQCKVYDPLLALSQDLQAARALCVIALLLALLECWWPSRVPSALPAWRTKAPRPARALTAGVLLLLAGILVLIPVCWTAHAIIQDFYNPLVAEALKRELGASLYLGWAASALQLLLGGGATAARAPRPDRAPGDRGWATLSSPLGGIWLDKRDMCEANVLGKPAAGNLDLVLAAPPSTLPSTPTPQPGGTRFPEAGAGLAAELVSALPDFQPRPSSVEGPPPTPPVLLLLSSSVLDSGLFPSPPLLPVPLHPKSSSLLCLLWPEVGSLLPGHYRHPEQPLSSRPRDPAHHLPPHPTFK